MSVFAKFKCGDKIVVIRNFCDHATGNNWYRKGEILTVSQIHDDSITFREYPGGAFQPSELIPSYVKVSDFVTLEEFGKLAPLLYGKRPIRKDDR